MKVKTEAPEARTVTIEATIDELVDLHTGLTRNRKTARDKAILAELALALFDSDPDLKTIVTAIMEEEGAENGETGSEE